MKSKKIARSTAGLADLMFEELESLRNGDSTPQHIRAVSSGVNTILQTKKLELDHARFVSIPRSDIRGELSSLPMGV